MATNDVSTPANQAGIEDQKTHELKWIFETISQEMKGLSALLIDLECSDVELRMNSLSVFKTTAEKVGVLANLGHNKLYNQDDKGIAESWLLPPSYKDH